MSGAGLAELNSRFGTAGRVAFRRDSSGLVVAVLACQHGSCEVALYGGQVMSYRPVGHGPALFISRHALYESGKAVRGGVPICWPWFGRHPENGVLPQHGFARLMEWRVVASEYSGEATELVLALEDSDETRHYWPYSFSLVLRVKLGEELTLELTTENHDSRAFTLTQCLHPYLRVRSLESVVVHGLDQAPYSEVQSKDTGVHKGPLVVDGVHDRAYRPLASECMVHDGGLRRTLALTFSGAEHLTVWNPGAELAREMKDLGDDEYDQMLCVEPCNYTPVRVEPGECHTLAMTLQVALV